MLFSDAVGAKILAQDLNILKLRQPAERHLLKMAASVALYQDKFVEIYADHIKIKSYREQTMSCPRAAECQN
jgi:hypothetical protein